MIRRLCLALALVGLAAGAPRAFAQPSLFRLLLEPHVGFFSDSYDISEDGHTLGPLGGLRASYALSPRLRLASTLTAARSYDVDAVPAGLTDYFLFDNNWLTTALGAEFDLLAGRTRLAVGLELGAGWQQRIKSGQIGSPDPRSAFSDDGFRARGLVMPGLYLRHAVNPDLGLVLGLQDRIMEVSNGPVDHSPTLFLGLTLAR